MSGDDFTTYDANLPPEYQAYEKQYTIPVPDDYVDEWHAEFGEYDPIRDECLVSYGVMPGLSVVEWQQKNPGKPFPIQQGIDRGFPARYRENSESKLGP